MFFTCSKVRLSLEVKGAVQSCGRPASPVVSTAIDNLVVWAGSIMLPLMPFKGGELDITV